MTQGRSRAGAVVLQALHKITTDTGYRTPRMAMSWHLAVPMVRHVRQCQWHDGRGGRHRDVAEFWSESLMC